MKETIIKGYYRDVESWRGDFNYYEFGKITKEQEDFGYKIKCNFKTWKLLEVMMFAKGDTETLIKCSDGKVKPVFCGYEVVIDKQEEGIRLEDDEHSIKYVPSQKTEEQIEEEDKEALKLGYTIGKTGDIQ